MSKALMRDIPFVAARHLAGKQRPKTIAIRLSETTSDSGAALAIAYAWHKRNSKVDSCHYVVDAQATYQCVPDNFVTFSYPALGKGVISINVCAIPTSKVDTWQEQGPWSAFNQTAKLVAALSHKYHIPICYVDFEKHSSWWAKGGLINCVKGEWYDLEFLELVNQYKNRGGG